MEWAQSGFASRLEQAYKAKGFSTLKDFAEKKDYKYSTVWGWKNFEPSYAEISRLARDLDVTPCFLAFGSDKPTARDEAEELALAQWRKIPEAKRADVLAALTAVAGVAPDSELILLGEKAKAKAEARAAAKPAPPSAAPAAPPSISSTLQLSREEARALRAWLGTQVKTMPIERPLTKAIRKIASLTGPGSALRAPEPDRDRVPAVPDPAAAGESSGAAPAPPPGRRKADRKPS